MTPWNRVLRAAALAAVSLAVLVVLVPVGWLLAGSTPAGRGDQTPLQSTPALGTDATNAAELRSTLAAMGRKSLTWNVTFMSDDQPLDDVLLDASAAVGVRHNVVTLEIWSLQNQTDVLKKIAAGAVDDHLVTIAGQMRQWLHRHPGSELIVRPLHEADITAYPWGFAAGNTHGNQMTDFAPAWSHVWHVMRAVAPELKFFLCPNGADGYSYNWGVPLSQVDYVGHDLFNRSQDGFAWQSPGQLHDSTIWGIREVYPGKPYVIAETATSEPGPGVTGHSKAQWFRDLAAWMKGSAARDGLVAVCYFDHDKPGEEVDDWRIYPAGKPGAEESRQAFRRAFAGFP